VDAPSRRFIPSRKKKMAFRSHPEEAAGAALRA
jgi:hypothetical protein